MTDVPHLRQSPVRTALAGLIGNVLEWFDFAVYGFFASQIGAKFFPSGDPDAEMIKTYGVFALGFAARPIGGIVLGVVGDRIGRRALLTLSIALMGTATLGIGLLPGYETIGIAAPILLMLFRIVQGFSLGGEFTGSMVYTTELASPLARGLISSSTAAGTTLGFILGSASAYAVSRSMSDAAAADWGWRIPFIASVLFCLAGFLLRRGIVEPEEGKLAAAQRAPIAESLLADWRPIVQTFGIVALTNAAYYLTFTYAVEQRKAEKTSDIDFQLANTLALFVVLFAKPLGGWLSDRVGRRRMMIGLTALTLALVYPVFRWLMTGVGSEFMFAQAALGIPLGMALGLQGAMLVEIFPLRTRVTSMSFAYSVSLALSGGIAPLVAKHLSSTHPDQPMLPAFFVMAYALPAFAVLLTMRETNARRLDQ